MKASRGSRRRHATLHDIADRLQVSVTAVSMALRNTGGVSEELRLRVERTASELNYAPALAARLLRGKQTGQIGLLVPQQLMVIESSAGFYLPALAHFVDTCDRHRKPYQIEFGGRENGSFRPPRQLTGRLVDGVLLLGAQSADLYQWLAKNPEYRWVNIGEPGPHCVLFGTDIGIMRAVEHLAALGHRRIAFAGGTSAFEVHAAAWRGFERAMGEFGLDAGAVTRGEFTWSTAAAGQAAVDAWVTAVLTAPRRPSAIVCTDQKFANVIMARAAWLGVHIPRDLSLIAHGIRHQADAVFPRTTIIETDFHAVIESALAMLLQLIQRQPVAQPRVVIEPCLVKNESVGPVPDGLRE